MNKYSILILLASLSTNSSIAFDLEDYATTFRATRDAKNKAYREYVLSKVGFNEKVVEYSFTPNGAGDAVEVSSKMASCPGVMEPSLARNNRVKIAQDLGQLINHPIIKNFHSQGGFPAEGLTDVLAAAGQYYSKMDPSLNNLEDNLRHDESYLDLQNQTSYLFKPVPEFDREDFASQYRMYRDAYLKSLNELKLSMGPYDAAKAAYMTAFRTFWNYADCADNGGFMKPLEEQLLNVVDDQF
jgi:hypothetical protein